MSLWYSSVLNKASVGGGGGGGGGVVCVEGEGGREILNYES